ncbi:EAL domain-containing protein [Marinobacter sp. CHS3-4]|uniref:sensor domain-containing phosphodiesterase n=1 Tax=Marinobacter sp. CHS3-4 TaxID=3045174 RepID=UPI0024B613AB|nr:EAL domain-containing protein [Marinobacter sp. CHS3-4]MDI9245418.1 EAL domain-containing protein [Marinobacter sp. CHS3-4]
MISSRATFRLIQARDYLILAITVVVLADLSRYLTVESLPISLIWPPGGVIFGATLILGLPALVVSCLALAAWLFVLQEASLATALYLPIAQGVGIYGALWLIIRSEMQSGVGERGDHWRRNLYIRAGILSATISALMGAAGFYFGDLGQDDFAFYDLFLVYWLLEAMGLLLFAPLAYFFLKQPAQFVSEWVSDARTRRISLWYGTVAILFIMVLVAPQVLLDRTYAAALGFCFFPALCWFVLVARSPSVLVVLPVFASIFVVFSLNGLGGLPQITSIGETVRTLLSLAGLTVLVQVIGTMTYGRRQMIAKFREQAYTDFVSGLNNDRAFSRLVQTEIEQQTCAWLVNLRFLDFDPVEDLMGYRAARQLESALVARLMSTMGADASPARLGKGVFGLILPSSTPARLQQDLDHIYQAFDNQVFFTEHQQTRVRVAIGAVEIDGSLGNPDRYLSAATMAARQARDKLPRIQVVEDLQSLIQERRSRTQRLEMLKEAFSGDQLVLFAQPICGLGDKSSALHYEILVRLRDPDGQILSPASFMPIAESHGLMRQIDYWVIRKTLEFLAANPKWMAATEKCSINLAGATLSSDDVIDYIAEVFEQTGVPPEKIGFEVTETQQILSRDCARSLIDKLRSFGCAVSLDDFGTGLATFDYLRSFQFDTLKIDGVFVRQIDTNDTDRHMVKAICDVASEMNLTTVAEYVENDRILAVLTELGVDYGQGYGIGRPMPLEDLFTDFAQLDGTPAPLTPTTVGSQV